MSSSDNERLYQREGRPAFHAPNLFPQGEKKTFYEGRGSSTGGKKDLIMGI